MEKNSAIDLAASKARRYTGFSFCLILRRFADSIRLSSKKEKVMANIIQAEFFHVGGRGRQQTLDDLIGECINRRNEGASIKTVLRFYDDDRGSITRNVVHYKELDDLHEALVQKVFASHGLSRWFLDMSARQVARTRARAKKGHMRLVMNRLWEIPWSHQNIAVEEGNHHFRYAKWDEKKNLLAVVGKGKSVWLFVFEHNDLLADSNVSVARAM